MPDPFQETGGYMNTKINKLEEQVAQSSSIFKQSNLFEGISIFVNGWTNPTADDLKRIMMTYGGTYHHYERKHTTFIVAQNLPDVKIRNMNTSNVINPKWVVDCIKANKILDYSKYLLYTNQKRSQPALKFKSVFDDFDDEDSYASRNSSVMKRKPAAITDANEATKTATKLKTNGQTNEILPDADDKKPVIEVVDSSAALEALNQKLCGGSEVKAEQDTSIKKTADSSSNPTFKVARNANDPKFLSEFYNNSRLHHIATLGAGFKQYVTELRDSHSGQFPAREELIKILRKNPYHPGIPAVMHIDMDCFFVSVGLRSHSHLKGCPIAVTHSKGGAETAERPGVDRQKEMELYMKRLEDRLEENILGDKREKIRNGFDGKESLSEIASCSYEARQKGVKNGMFVGQALKLCPDLKTIPYDFEGYKEVAFQLYDTIAQYTLDIEAVSCDEMFVDLTSLLNGIKVDVMDFVTHVREEVRQKTKCPCSAGIGTNRLQARMATKKAKPDGQYHLDSDTVLQYMSDIPIRELPGVGYSTECALKQLNWEKCGDLQQISLSRLQTEFGKKFGETLYQFCRGIDNKPLVFGQIRKSVSAEVNYGIRFSDNAELEKFLKQLCEEVHSRLKQIKRKGKCITLKVMVRAKQAPQETAKFMGHGFCDSMNKSVSLSDYTCELETITRTVLATMKALNIPPKELRGLGIQISKLDDPNDAKKTNIIKNMFSKAIEIQKEKKIPSSKRQVISDDETVPIEDSPKKKQQPIKKPFFQPSEVKNKPKSPTKTQANNVKHNKTPEKLNQPAKGRGKSTKSNNSTSNYGNIMNMFQNVVEKQNKALPQPKKVYEANEIDPSILAELPEELQKEILNENRISMQVFPSLPKKAKIESEEPENKVEKKIEVDIEFLNALPPNLRREIEQEIAESRDKYAIKGTTSTGNFTVIEPNQNDLAEAGPSKSNLSIVNENNNISTTSREYVRNWINGTQIPKKNNIEIFCRDMHDMIQTDGIDNAIDAISELYRLISEMVDCKWHLAYKSIVEHLQMYSPTDETVPVVACIDCDECS